jgi:hypothetical protein
VLIQLIYTSTATSELSEADLGRILEAAVRNNLALDVTGLLLYSKGTFMQVLEGEDGAVGELLERIGADPRHRDIQVHVRTPVRRREFSQWHMGFRSVRDGDAASLPNYAPFFEDGFDSAMLSAEPGECLALMTALAALA